MTRPRPGPPSAVPPATTGSPSDPYELAIVLLVGAAGEHERAGRLRLARAHLAHAHDLARLRATEGSV